MAYLTLAIYNTDGVQRDFAVPFSFIKKEYVYALVQTPNDRGYFVDSPEAVPFSWLNDQMIRLDTVPPRGLRVYIARETYADQPLVDFQDAAILVEEDLDLTTLQALHVAQEARDSNLAALQDAIEYFKDEHAKLEEYVDEADDELQKQINELEKNKADKGDVASKLHAKEHAIGGSDPLTPEQIGALKLPPATGKNYLANIHGWTEYIQDGTIAAPAAVLVQVFAGTGKDTEFIIQHPFKTRNVVVSTYLMDPASSDERVHFTEYVLDDKRVKLVCAAPLAKGIMIRAVLIAIGDDAGGTGGRREFTHDQTRAAKTWIINHQLGVKHVKVLVIDSDGNRAVPGIDWNTATDSTVQLQFCMPITGKAILTL